VIGDKKRAAVMSEIRSTAAPVLAAMIAALGLAAAALVIAVIALARARAA
jgi:hypothetical protein